MRAQADNTHGEQAGDHAEHPRQALSPPLAIRTGTCRAVQAMAWFERAAMVVVAVTRFVT